MNEERGRRGLAALGSALPGAGKRKGSRTLLAVLGMHRSGTSATAGILQELGIELGPVSERARFNARGNREIRELNQLHNAILEPTAARGGTLPTLPG